MVSPRSSRHPGVSPLDGVLVVDKPGGLTSHDVVARVRRLLGTKRVGHIGTLDPMATGVLPLVVERATRLASLLSSGDKVYHAVVRLGVTTDTYDATGIVIEADGGPRTLDSPIDKAAVADVARRFFGTFPQTPPPFSAKKIGGVRAYRLARRKQPVTPPPVDVTVRSIEIETVDDDLLTCRVTCAPGFYMRSLAHDLGRALGVGGCLRTLRRERSGPFTLSDVTPLDVLEREPESAVSRIVGVAHLLSELPSVVVTESGARLAAHGNTLMGPEFEPAARDPVFEPFQAEDAGGEKLRSVRVFDRDGTLLAIAEQRLPNVLHPRIVLV